MGAEDAASSVAALERTSPDAVALAKLASLAVRVEPELLRALRLAFLPATDASVELDLWHSPLVAASSSAAMTLRPDVGEHLREELGREAQAAVPGELSLLEQARALIEALHAGHPEVIRIEERIRWCSVAPGDHAEEVARLLDGVARTMIEDSRRRTGLAAWAARALPALPRAAQETPAAWTIGLAAAGELGYAVQLGGEPPPTLVEHFPPALLGGAPRVTVRVQRGARELELVAGEAGELSIEVPATKPLVLEVSRAGDEAPPTLVRLRPKIPVTVPIDARDVSLRTLDGREYLLSLEHRTVREDRGDLVLPWEERTEWIEGATAQLEGDPEATVLFIGERHALILGAREPLSGTVTDDDGALITDERGAPIVNEGRHRLLTSDGRLDVVTEALAWDGVGLARLMEPWRGPALRVQDGAEVGDECLAYVPGRGDAPPRYAFGTVYRDRDPDGEPHGLAAVLQHPRTEPVPALTPLLSRGRLIGMVTRTEVVDGDWDFDLAQVVRLSALGGALARVVRFEQPPPAGELGRARLASWVLRVEAPRGSDAGSACAFLVEAPWSEAGALVTVRHAVAGATRFELHREDLPVPGADAGVGLEAESEADDLALLTAPELLELASATLPLAHEPPVPGDRWAAAIFDAFGYAVELRGRVVDVDAHTGVLLLEEGATPPDYSLGTSGAPLLDGGEVRGYRVADPPSFTQSGAAVLVRGAVVGVLQGRSAALGHLRAIPVAAIQRLLARSTEPFEADGPRGSGDEGAPWVAWLIQLSAALSPDERQRGFEEMFARFLDGEQAIQRLAPAEDPHVLHFNSSERLARKLHHLWRSGAMSKASGGAVTWFEVLDPLARSPRPDDLQRGLWGWLPEQNGRRLWARVERAGELSRLFEIELEVTSTDPARPLEGTVELHLHPTFQQTLRLVPVQDGRATLRLAIYGAFTVGAVADEGQTELELDLANLPQLPQELLDA